MIRYRKKDELNDIFSLQAEFRYTRATPNTVSEFFSYFQTLISKNLANKKLKKSLRTKIKSMDKAVRLF